MRHYWQCKEFRDWIRFHNTCLLALLGFPHECVDVIDPHHYPPLSSQESDDSDCLPFCRTAHRLYDTCRAEIVALLERSNVAKLKASYWKGFISFLGFQTQKPTVKVKNRPKAEAVKTSKFQTAIDQSSKRGKGSATRPLNVPKYNQL